MSVFKSYFIHLRDLRRFRWHLSYETAIMAANSLLSICLNYYTALFKSHLRLNLCKLQCIQKSLARVVTSSNRYVHVTPTQRSLHWFPVGYLSFFTPATLVYKYFQTGQSIYLASYFSWYTCSYNSCSSNGRLFLWFLLFLLPYTDPRNI